jgi:hypothetical protein
MFISFISTGLNSSHADDTTSPADAALMPSMAFLTGEKYFI